MRKQKISRIREEIKAMPLHRRWIEAAGLLVIGLGLVTSVRMNLVGRSLWWDEAALAYSFSQRDLLHLTSEGLELIQSAPVGWLYTVKLLTLVFGNSDFILRVPSMLAYAGVLCMMFLLLRRVFEVRYPVACTAFAASFPLLLQYSNMFKPYITDAFFCLLVIWFYRKYEEEQWKPLKFGLSLAILIWFSNPVCFMAAGLMLADVLYALLEKKKIREKIKAWAAVCIPVGVSFLSYYVYWLRQTATDDRMRNYWRDWNFPLFPTSGEDFAQIKKLVETLFSQFYRLEYAVIILLAVFLCCMFHKRGKILTGLYFSMGVTVLASGLGMFPVNKRLWLFIYPLVMLILAAGTELVFFRKEETGFPGVSRVVGLIVLGCALLNGGIRYYWDAENVYWPGYEVKKEYEHLIQVIEPGESVYVFSSQMPIFSYYNQYDAEELADTGCRVMLGTDPLTEKYDCEEDFSYIIEAEKCYVVLGDTWDKKSYTQLLFPTLHEAGYFEMVYNEYETPLWYFCSDAEDSKAEAAFEVLSRETAEDTISYRVKIKNTGEAFLNPEFENLELAAEDGSQRIALPKNIAPGASVEVEISLPKDQSMSFRLENEYGSIGAEQQLHL